MKMASARQLAANRRNAQHSTGPRTARGKSRSKQNALRHGLAVMAPKTGMVALEIERLASAIAGPKPDPCRWHFALVAAEAEVELRRVRTVRLERLASAASATSSEPDGEQKQSLAVVLPDLLVLDQYEGRALSRRNKALRLL